MAIFALTTGFRLRRRILALGRDSSSGSLGPDRGSPPGFPRTERIPHFRGSLKRAKTEPICKWIRGKRLAIKNRFQRKVPIEMIGYTNGGQPADPSGSHLS